MSEKAIKDFSSLLENYKEIYDSDEIRDLVLLTEGFGVNIKISDKIMQKFYRMISREPVLSLYFPFLKTLIHEINFPDIIKKEETKSIKRFILTERRKNLVSIALASKYALYIEIRKYRDFIGAFIDMLVIVVNAVKDYLGDLDEIERTSLLYISELINILRKKLGKTPFDFSFLKSDDVSNLPLYVKAEIGAFLFEIYKITKKKEYLVKFYDIIHDVDVETLYYTLLEMELNSAKILKEYYNTDVESGQVTAFLFDKEGVSLLVKFVRMIREEFITVPIIEFDDFVSEYYSIPKTLLKAWKTLIKHFK